MFVFVYKKPSSIGLESDQTKFFIALEGYCYRLKQERPGLMLIMLRVVIALAIKVNPKKTQTT